MLVRRFHNTILFSKMPCYIVVAQLQYLIRIISWKELKKKKKSIHLLVLHFNDNQLLFT